MHTRSVNKQRYDDLQERRSKRYHGAKRNDPATVAEYERKIEARRKF